MGVVAALCVHSSLATEVDHAEHGAVVPFDQETALGVSQAAIGGRVGDYRFFDRVGRKVMLSELLGQPLVISMIYTSCHHVCPTLTRHLKDVVETGWAALGTDSFKVLTVGFDAGVDTPQRMASFAASRGIDISGWYFLSSDIETVTKLARDLGFQYRPSPRGYDHINQATVLNSKGTVTNQVYGIGFDIPLLIEPLKYLLRGQVLQTGLIEGWWRDVKLLCTVYDPASGRYHFDYSLIIAIVVGACILLCIGIFLVRAWRYTNRSEARS